MRRRPRSSKDDSDDQEAIEAERDRIEKENHRKQDEYDEKVKKGEQRAKELNARFADWYYVVGDETYRKIHLGQSGHHHEEIGGDRRMPVIRRCRRIRLNFKGYRGCRAELSSESLLPLYRALPGLLHFLTKMGKFDGGAASDSSFAAHRYHPVSPAFLLPGVFFVEQFGHLLADRMVELRGQQIAVSAAG